MNGCASSRLASFVSGRSDGTPTALRHLGEGYRAAGPDPVLVAPGAPDATERPRGRVTAAPATPA